jgi:hypothetical protein
MDAHPYRNMRWEFDQVRPRLGIGGMNIADDIQGNSPFDERRSRDLEIRVFIREKRKRFAVRCCPEAGIIMRRQSELTMAGRAICERTVS